MLCESYLPAAHAQNAGLPKGDLVLGPKHILNLSIPFVTSLLSSEWCEAVKKMCVGFFLLFFSF